MGCFHIISLSGTLSCNFGADLKIALADEQVDSEFMKFIKIYEKRQKCSTSKKKAHSFRIFSLFFILNLKIHTKKTKMLNKYAKQR